MRKCVCVYMCVCELTQITLPNVHMLQDMVHEILLLDHYWQLTTAHQVPPHRRATPGTVSLQVLRGYMFTACLLI